LHQVSSERDSLATSLAATQQAYTALDQQYTLLDNENLALTQKLSIKEFELQALRRELFGKSSEKVINLCHEQLPLFVGSIEHAPAVVVQKELVIPSHTRTAKPKIPRERELKIPDHLPVNKVVLDPPGCNCAHCQGELELFDYEVTTKLC
jgi:hypothetical protein